MTKTPQPLGPFVLHTPSAGGVYHKSWESAASGETTVCIESDLAAFALAAAYAAAGLPCLVRPARDSTSRTGGDKLNIADAQEYVAPRDSQFLGMLAELRLAVYRHSVSHRMPTDTFTQAKAAENAQAHAGLYADAAYGHIYSLLTAGIDDIIDREEAEARDAKGEAVGPSY